MNMMIYIRIILVFTFTVIGFGQFEVIKISDGLSEKTASRLWPVFKGGAITINKNEIIIPDGSNLYIQNRSAPFDYTKVNLKRGSNDYFTVYQATANKELFAYAVVGSDGHYYLFERKRKTGEVQGPEMRHALTADRMFLLKDKRLLATGLYRPQLEDYVRKYRSGPISEQKKNTKEKFDPLFLKYKAYTLSVYDKTLTEYDTGNVIDRIGDNAIAFEGLYLIHPVDTAAGEVVYLIDNDQGYVVEKYTGITQFDSSFEVKNPKFKKLPDVMTIDDMDDLRSRKNAYSVPYALYHKKGTLVSCFFQAPVRFDPVLPPFYFDISSLRGELLFSGQLEYPFLCEDDGEKLFLYIKQEGGWFESDRHFLVGVTVQDILNGKVKKENIDTSISKFEGD